MRVLLVLPTISDALEPDAKNAAALRNLAATEGRCCPDCGCVPTVHPDPVLPGVCHARFVHDDGCAALL